MTADTDEIRAAQEHLAERRATLGLTATSDQEAADLADFLRKRRALRTDTLADVLVRLAGGDPRADAPVIRHIDPRMVPLPPPPGVDPTALRTAIPDRFAGVTWATLAALLGPEGRPSLSGVTSPGKGVLVGAAAVQELRRRTSGPKSILLGPTRAGKSCSAAAWAEDRTRRGVRVVWVSSRALRDPAVLARALAAPALVVDNVGFELAGALPETGLCAQRAAPVIELFDELIERRGRELLVTTFLEPKTTPANPISWESLYGGGTMARAFEGVGAGLVRIGGPP